MNRSHNGQRIVTLLVLLSLVPLPSAASVHGLMGDVLRYVPDWVEHGNIEDSCDQWSTAFLGCVEWSSGFDDPDGGAREFGSMAVHPTSRAVFVASANRIARFDAGDGHVVWNEAWGGRNAIDALALSRDGETCYVVGRDFDRVRTEAYRTSDGARLWWRGESPGSSGFGVAAGGPDNAAYVAVGVGGRAVVSKLGGTTGTEIWRTDVGLDPSLELNGVKLRVSEPAGVVLVAGNARVRPGSVDFFGAAVDDRTGTVVWRSTQGFPGSGDEFVRATALSPDGTRWYVVGDAAGRDPRDYGVVAWDVRTGGLLWAKARHFSGYDTPFGVTTSPDGEHVVVAGDFPALHGGSDLGIVAMDARTGGEAWVSIFSGPGAGYELPTGIAYAPDGHGLFVTSYSEGEPATGDDFLTLAIDASTGREDWRARYTGPGGWTDEYPLSLAVEPDGTRVFVAGITRGNFLSAADIAFSYTVVAYRSSGPDFGVRT